MINLRMTQEKTAQTLGLSISTLKRRYKNNPEFPQPIKDGTTRQAHVYFVTREIEALVQKQMDERDNEAA